MFGPASMGFSFTGRVRIKKQERTEDILARDLFLQFPSVALNENVNVCGGRCGGSRSGISFYKANYFALKATKD